MKNVTISMDDETAAWARVEAAKQGKSLSRYVGDLLADKRGTLKTRQQHATAFLSGPLWPVSDETGQLPSRAELYAERLHRHEHPDLFEGSAEPDEAKDRGEVAGRPERP
jgi:hypothetical protein